MKGKLDFVSNAPPRSPRDGLPKHWDRKDRLITGWDCKDNSD